MLRRLSCLASLEVLVSLSDTATIESFPSWSPVANCGVTGLALFGAVRLFFVPFSRCYGTRLLYRPCQRGWRPKSLFFASLSCSSAIFRRRPRFVGLWPKNGCTGLPLAAAWAYRILLSLRRHCSCAISGTRCRLPRPMLGCLSGARRVWLCFSLFSAHLGQGSTCSIVCFPGLLRRLLGGRSWDVFGTPPSKYGIADETRPTTSRIMIVLFWKPLCGKTIVIALVRCAASSLVRHFRDLSFVRPREFINRFGRLPDSRIFLSLLDRVDFGGPRLRSLACSHFLSNVFVGKTLLLPRLSACFFHLLESATHGWSFQGVDFGRLANHRLYRMLHVLPPIIRWPHISHGLPLAPNWAALWKLELSLDRYILPVLIDLKFRLQHSALGVRRKHAYHTRDVSCPHGCPFIESTRHLFWNCSIAQALGHSF